MVGRDQRRKGKKNSMTEDIFCVMIHFTILELEMINYLETARIVIMSYHGIGFIFFQIPEIRAISFILAGF